MEAEGQFLDGHVLVADGVIALVDLELAGVAGDGVLVDADGVQVVARQAWLGCPSQLVNGGAGHLAQERAESIARKHAATAGQDRQSHIVQRREMEDAGDAEDGLEEQRQHQARGVLRPEDRGLLHSFSTKIPQNDLVLSSPTHSSVGRPSAPWKSWR